MLGIWDFRDDVGDVACWGCGMFRMWGVEDVGCWRCGMLGKWNVQDVECLGCEMSRMRDWDAWDIGCL